MLRRSIAGLLTTGVLLAGCGSSGSDSSSPPSTSAASDGSGKPVPITAEPAGPNPSEAAVMVCSEEAQEDIEEILGVAATEVTTPTWVDHLYSCDYQYPNAVIGVSVKDLSTPAETVDYYDGLKEDLGEQRGALGLGGLGDDAFRTKNGGLVVRKDYKVMYVDVSQMPEAFGPSTLAPVYVAHNVGETIMGCWVDA